METVLVEKKNINEVVELLKQDEVVAFPTETVFGLGVKFGNLSALEKIYEIKHRSHSKAVSLMIYDSQDIEKYAYVNTNAQKLIDEFMPGMITLVLKKKSILSDDFTAGLETIGIRIPDDPFVLELLKRVGPMLVTSANISGQETLLNDLCFVRPVIRKRQCMPLLLQWLSIRFSILCLFTASAGAFKEQP